MKGRGASSSLVRAGPSTVVGRQWFGQGMWSPLEWCLHVVGCVKLQCGSRLVQEEQQEQHAHGCMSTAFCVCCCCCIGVGQAQLACITLAGGVCMESCPTSAAFDLYASSLASELVPSSCHSHNAACTDACGTHSSGKNVSTCEHLLSLLGTIAFTPAGQQEAFALICSYHPTAAASCHTSSCKLQNGTVAKCARLPL